MAWGLSSSRNTWGNARRIGCKACTSTGQSLMAMMSWLAAARKPTSKRLALLSQRTAIRAAAITQFRADQRRSPLLRLKIGQAAKLLGKHALFQGKLLGMGHMLQAATTADLGMRAGLAAAFGVGGENAFDPRLDHLAVGAEYPRFDLLAGQCATDKPGAPLAERDTPAVVGQALDSQFLLLAHRHLGGTGTAAGLKAQAAVFLGH